MLDEAAAEPDPESALVTKETISLAYLATIQLLPARQRAVLILRDVLGWPATETASLLELSVAAANSALQRARATLREHLPEDHAEWSTSDPSADELALLNGFIHAHQRGDWETSVKLMREDIRVTMPPHPFLYDGIAALIPLFERAFGPESPGEWRLVPTRQPHAHRRQLPESPRRHRVPRRQVRRAPGRGRPHRRDYDLRRQPLPGVRSAGRAAVEGTAAGRVPGWAHDRWPAADVLDGRRAGAGDRDAGGGVGP
ncbi:sigma factor-like helix-turn-helix DNA-binding protein [Actinophytocola sp.]|uniref:sigma factor-like helix-turn-helix DNA-binding protein n=1 Tax=Actinophytocola sp. TaxID=1872138 RepID=UPI002E190F14